MGSDDGLVLSETMTIPRSELTFRASRAGGAGGQHVNTSSTRIELLWNVQTTQAMDEDARARIASKLASRIDGQGFIRVVSSARRSQGQNRLAAEERLVFHGVKYGEPYETEHVKPGELGDVLVLECADLRGDRRLRAEALLRSFGEAGVARDLEECF